MNQKIQIARNKEIYESKEAALVAINTIVYHEPGLVLLHLYNQGDDTYAGLTTVGRSDGYGEDKYDLLVSELYFNDLSIYSNDEPTLTALGGVAIGTTFDKVTHNDLFTNILYPYVAPTISISSNKSTGTYEHGIVISEILITINTVKKTNKITSSTITYGGTTYDITVYETGGTTTYSMPDISSTTSISAKVSDGTNTTTSNTLSYSFVYPCYVGSTSNETPSADEILNMTKKVQSSANFAYTYSTLETECMVVATPLGWTLSSIIDPNGFDVTDSFVVSNMDIVGLDNTSVSYTLYVSGFTSQSNYTMTFNK